MEARARFQFSLNSQTVVTEKMASSQQVLIKTNLPPTLRTLEWRFMLVFVKGQETCGRLDLLHLTTSRIKQYETYWYFGNSGDPSPKFESCLDPIAGAVHVAPGANKSRASSAITVLQPPAGRLHILNPPHENHSPITLRCFPNQRYVLLHKTRPCLFEEKKKTIKHLWVC